MTRKTKAEKDEEEEKLKTGYIYCITNNINNQCYIGQTIQTVEKRFKHHCSSAKRGQSSPLYDDMRAFGIEYFTVQTLQMVEECGHGMKHILDEHEKNWIKTVQTLYPQGYNVTPGGHMNKRKCKYYAKRKRAIEMQNILC